MKNTRTALRLGTALALMTLVLASQGFWNTSTNGAPVAVAAGLPQVAFEAEAGQGAPEARFVAHLGGAVVRFLPGEVDLALPAIDRAPHVADAPPPPPRTLQVRFVGESAGVAIRAGAELPGKVNYLIGADPSK